MTVPGRQRAELAAVPDFAVSAGVDAAAADLDG